MKKIPRGFTLIELMIVIVVVSILVAIAIPSYQHQLQESHRAAAKSSLLDLAASEEKYFATNNAYTSTLANLGYSNVLTTGCNGGATSCLQAPSTTEYYYSVTVATSGNGAHYTAQATPVFSQISDGCGTYQVTDQGNYTVTGTLQNCW